MNRRIVITGVGTIASTGIGKEAFWKGLKEGTSGIKPVTLFNTSTLNSKIAGEISGLDARSILGQKGLRNLDRTTLLLLCASRLALEDSGFESPLPEELSDSVGVAIGSTMGSVWSISEFDKTTLVEGPRSVNPALFPNTVINSPASHVSIKFNIKGFNSTISTGFCSGLDAIYYATTMMDLYGYSMVLAGGVEELCEQTYKGFHKIGYLSGSRQGKEEINCPFDLRRNGIVLGEGASVFMLEELEHARERSAGIYAEVLGYGTAYDPSPRNLCDPEAVCASRAIRFALDDARLDKDAVDYVSATANSTLDCDVMETRAIKRIFGPRSKDLPLSSIKSMIGETFSASGAMNIAAALAALNEGFLPPTINYKNPDKRCDLDYVPNETRKGSVKNVLVNAFSPTGSNSSVVIGRYE